MVLEDAHVNIYPEKWPSFVAFDQHHGLLGISRWSSFHPMASPGIKACASDIALQTVGVTAVNCFAGGRFVFIGRRRMGRFWGTRNLELIG